MECQNTSWLRNFGTSLCNLSYTSSLRRLSALVKVSIEDSFPYFKTSSLSTWQMTHFTSFCRFGGKVILKPEESSRSLLAMEINLKNAPIQKYDTPIAVVFCKKMKSVLNFSKYSWFSHDNWKKLELKIISFYLYQAKSLFKHISVGLSSAR